MDEPFEACWQRIERAEAHRKASVDVWNEFMDSHPYDSSLDEEGEGQFVLRVIQTKPTPDELGVVIGEWFYNLRCALDYAVWAAAVHTSGELPPPNEGVLQYPIYSTWDGWTRNLYRLKPLTDDQRARLKVMQPCNREDPDTNFLYWINELARIDRHRRLNVVTSYMSTLSPIFGYPKVCEATIEFGDRILIDGEAQIARITLTPWQHDWKVIANPRVGIDPEIAEWAESAFWKRIPYDQRVRMMQLFVQGEVVAFEYECTGASRKADLLTDSFKIECDGKRQVRQIVRHGAATEPNWIAAPPGNPVDRIDPPWPEAMAAGATPQPFGGNDDDDADASDGWRSRDW